MLSSKQEKYQLDRVSITLDIMFTLYKGHRHIIGNDKDNTKKVNKCYIDYNTK